MSCGDCLVVRDVNNRTRSVGRAVSRPYSDLDESDNDVFNNDHDSTVQQVSLRNNWLTPTVIDSCGERCTQLDDFNWFLPVDERTGDLQRDDGSSIVMPSGGHSGETYGGL